MKVKSNAPTMKDVAREAGVALGTVSKVLNDLPVGESYRIRVQEAAQKLGYQVNSYARGMRSGKTGTVSLILPNVTDPFFSALTEHVCHALSKRDYRMLLSVTGSNPSIEQQCIRMVQLNKVDGIIGLTYNPLLDVSDQTAFVSVDRNFSSAVPCVASDNFAGGQMAAEKLIELGCKRLLFFRIGSDVPSEADKRGVGFQSVCSLRGVPQQSLMLNDRDGYGPFREFLQQHITGGSLAYDGIFCNTDRLATAVIGILRGLDLHVPRDVQVIGFDGIRHFGTGDPYCSTIAQPVPQLAEACVDTLLRGDRSNLPSLICLPVTYVSGGTTRD